MAPKSQVSRKLFQLHGRFVWCAVEGCGSCFGIRPQLVTARDRWWTRPALGKSRREDLRQSPATHQHPCESAPVWRSPDKICADALSRRHASEAGGTTCAVSIKCTMRGPASALDARMVRVISARSCCARCLPRRVRLCTQRGSLRIAFSLRVLDSCTQPRQRRAS